MFRWLLCCCHGVDCIQLSILNRHQSKKIMQEDEEEAILNAIDKEFKKYLSNSENLESAANTVVDDLIDDAILSVVFELDIMRKSKFKESMRSDNDSDMLQMLDSEIVGQTSGKKGSLCTCPVCSSFVAFEKFAPHLATCMGLARTSSRIARNRIANNANKDIGEISDDEGDADWTEKVSERRGKKKREKTSNKKLKTSKTVKNGNSSNDVGSHSSSNHISYENMSDRDRKALFTQICGVISEHTKKVCTKSPKCSQHSEEEKKAIRTIYSTEIVDTYIDNLQIDVEDDTESGKNSLTRSWEAEHSNTSSPADSASTSSSSSKKREKAPAKSKKQSQTTKHGRSSAK